VFEDFIADYFVVKLAFNQGNRALRDLCDLTCITLIIDYHHEIFLSGIKALGVRCELSLSAKSR
jgi:hypothetical protein